jgi:MFS transporter, SP family, xylose:H+ symportor
MEKTQRYNAGYVWPLAGVAALGGLLFGYDFVVIGGAKPFYESFFRLASAAQIGWANSCALLGSVFSGAAADRFGRKRLLIASAVLFAVSSVLTGWAPVFLAFVVWRIAGGVAIGIASNVSPVYIAEISPAPWRGRLVSLNQMTIVMGILSAQIVNWLIAHPVPAGATAEMIRQSWNGQAGWRWMFTAVAVPSLIFLAGSLFVPESPRWVALRGRKDIARRTLSRIGGDTYAEAALADIFSAAEPHARENWRAQLLAPGMRRILGVGVILAVFSSGAAST